MFLIFSLIKTIARQRFANAFGRMPQGAGRFSLARSTRG